MASVLQVKRSSSNTDGSGLTLASGELAYSTRNVSCVGAMNYVPELNGGALWIGDNNGDKRLVGGDAFTRLLTHAPGTTTSTAAVVVDSNKAVDTIGSTNFFTSHQNTGCFTVKTNQAAAFKIYDNTGTPVEYMNIDTTTDAQCITFSKPLNVTNLSTAHQNTGCLTIKTNQASALKIYDNAGTAVEYLNIDTTTSSGCVTFCQPAVFGGGSSSTAGLSVKGNFNTSLTATSSGTTVTATSAHGLNIGDAVSMPSGSAGASEVFSVSSVTNTTVFVVDSSPSNNISSATIKINSNLLDVKTGDNATKVIVSKSGRLGVGTSTPSTSLHISCTDGLIIPVGNTTQRSGTATQGEIRYNTTLSSYEGYNGSAWDNITSKTYVDTCIANETGGSVTYGIANTNVVCVDHASVADNDYAKFTASGVEGRSFAEVKSDLSIVDVTLAGSYDYLTISGQEITRNQIDLSADVTGTLPNANLGNSAITINGTSVSLGGTRTLVTDDIAEDGSPTNLWYTDERVDDRVSSLLQDSCGLSWTYADGSGTLTPVLGNLTIGNAITFDDSTGSSLCIISQGGTSSYIGFQSCENVKGTVGFSTGCTFYVIGCDGSTNLLSLTCAGLATADTFCGTTQVKSPTIQGTTQICTSGKLMMIDATSLATEKRFFCMNWKPTVTAASGNLYNIGAHIAGEYGVQTGCTHCGYDVGIAIQRLGGDTLAGTVLNASALYAQFGHYSDATGTTCCATGICIEPYYYGGTVTCGYAMYVKAPVTGGTITNQYGLYIDGSSACNYFAGKVGIGETSPDSPLHIKFSGTAQTGASQSYYGTLVMEKSSATWNRIRFDCSGCTQWGIAVGADEKFHINNLCPSYTAGVGDALVIDTNSNVGIGTTVPEAKLDIQSGNIALVMGADNGAGTLTDATTKTARMGVHHYTNAEEPSTLFVVDSESTTGTLSIGGGTSSMNATSFIKFFTASNGTTTTGTERMRIDNNGCVGIGTDTPKHQLHVEDHIGLGTPGEASTTHSIQLARSDSGATNRAAINFKRNADGDEYITFDVLESGVNGFTPMTLNCCGNVGIGDTDPDTSLSIIKASGTAIVAIDAETSGSNYHSGVLLRNEGSDKWLVKNDATADSFQIYNYAQTTTALYIDPDVCAIGLGRAHTVTAGSRSTAIGWEAKATGQASVHVTGDGGCAEGDVSSAFGKASKATGACSTAVGACNLASGAGSSSMGFSSCTTGTDSSAFGRIAKATANYSTAVGFQSYANIACTANISQPLIHKKDSGETTGGDFAQFSSTETTLMTKEIDLKTAACHTITVPTGATFFINEAGIISTCVDTLTTQAKFKIGCGDGSNTNTILDETQSTELTVAKKRERYIPNNSEDGLQTIVVEISTVASATSAKGRFYFKGMLVEDE